MCKDPGLKGHPMTWGGGESIEPGGFPTKFQGQAEKSRRKKGFVGGKKQVGGAHMALGGEVVVKGGKPDPRPKRAFWKKKKKEREGGRGGRLGRGGEMSVQRNEGGGANQNTLRREKKIFSNKKRGAR